jgi:phage tail sheath protein FI
MSFQVSPGVEVREIDLTNVVPAVSSSIGGIAGAFAWGPVEQIVTVGSEKDLVNVFGKPNDDTYKYFMPAAQFLQYTNALKVVRTENADLLNAAAGSTGVLIKNSDTYDSVVLSGDTAGEGFEFIAKYPGELGNSLKVVVCSSAAAFAHSSFTDYAGQFDFAPGVSRYASDRGLVLNTAGDNGDEMHIVVIDEDGIWTGSAGTILEVFQGASQASDAKKDDGASNYYVDVVNRESSYVWFGRHDDELTEAGDTIAAVGVFGYTTLSTATTYSLGGGSDGTLATPTVGELQLAYDLFADAETIDVNLLIGPDVAEADDVAIANALITIAEGRKDLVVFLSPATAETVNNTAAVTDVKAWADGVTSSSYAVLDSTALYVYDKYNDKYRWIIASGAVAGLCAYTDSAADPWFSPAGFTRGQIRGVTKIAYNPKKADRDTLYKARVNPIVAFPGEGIVLYGDKTALTKPSAFDRINVRRLFITLEKSVATAAKFQLFEFNDEFSRAQFRNLVEPFLRDVQGRRGITDFAVICDDTNNTGEVIDTNRFVADIYIKPAKSINFITLNFIATRTGVEFSEITGQ